MYNNNMQGGYVCMD